MPLRFESARGSSGGQRLAQILQKGPLPLEQALRFATDIAAALRELHDDGRVHGAVDPLHIVIRSSEASLAPVERRGYPDPLEDLSGFGNVLYAMLTGHPEGGEEIRLVPGRPGALKGTGAVRAAALRVAERCLSAERETAPELQKILTEVRLLHVMSKQCSPEAPGAYAPRPVAPPATPMPMVVPPPLSLEMYAGEAAPVINPPATRVPRAMPSRISQPAPAEAFMEPEESEPAPPLPPPIAPAAPPPPPEPSAAAAPPPAEAEPAAAPPASRKRRTKGQRSQPFLPDVACPKCRNHTVRLSRPRTRFERMLNFLGIGVHRCQRCYYRYIPLLGRKIIRKPDSEQD